MFLFQNQDIDSQVPTVAVGSASNQDRGGVGFCIVSSRPGQKEMLEAVINPASVAW